MTAPYGEDYFIDNGYRTDQKRMAMKTQEARRVAARMPEDAMAILDVGCGIGDFLADHFPEWLVRTGVEPDEFAAGEAGKRGLSIIPTLYDLKYKIASDPSDHQFQYDAVIFRGTFQHLDYPLLDLRCAIDLLRPGGLLCLLATPNSNSIVYKLFGDLPALDAPRNYVVPSDRMLRNILTNLHMEQIEILYPYWDTPYAKPMFDMACFAWQLLTWHSKPDYAFPRNMMEIYCKKPEN
jgi:SAM-dependent methyltransferase